MKPSPDKLTPKQMALVVADFANSNGEEAAASIGVPARTARRWRQKPSYQAAVREHGRHLANQSDRLLLRYRGAAAATLVRNLSADNAADRNRAASLILEHSGHALEWTNILDRVENLERRQTGGYPPLRVVK